MCLLLACVFIVGSCYYLKIVIFVESLSFITRSLLSEDEQAVVFGDSKRVVNWMPRGVKMVWLMVWSSFSQPESEAIPLRLVSDSALSLFFLRL